VSAGNTANGHGTFDLDAAVAAAKSEAESEPFRFTWHGRDYSLPVATDWPVQAQAFMSDGKLADAMGLLLGEDEWAVLAATGITLGTLNTLFEEIGRAAGIGGLPNSSPPAALATTRT
jgi:hypothetical protein